MADDIYSRIKQSYMDLYSDRKEIKIASLCDHIDITMSEFYQCYHDLDDLRSQMQRDIIRDMGRYIEEKMGDVFGIGQYIGLALDYVESNMDEFDFYINTVKDTSFLEQWKKALYKAMKKNIPDTEQLKLEMVSYSIIMGMVCIIRDGSLDDSGTLIEFSEKMASLL